jgi:serine/threonine-protein kinase
VLLLGPIALVGSGFAAAQPQAPARASYVGKVTGTRAFVAVVVRDSRVTAYVCDSRKIAHWFSGSVRGGKATLVSRGYVLRITVGSRRTTGSVSFPGAAGVAHGFSAAKSARPAGLYRGAKTVGGRRYLGGWIILPDGRQRGEVISGSTDVASPTLNPDDPTVDVKKGKKRPLIIIIVILIG